MELNESKDSDRKDEIDVKLGNALSRLNQKKLEEECDYLERTEKAKGKSASIFSLKERILGRKNSPSESQAIEDPSSGFLIREHDKIKEVTLKYCAKILTNKKPNKGYENILKRKEELHAERMEEEIGEDIEELSREQFDDALKHVSKKHSEKYRFILKGGKSLKDALFALFS